MALLPGDENIKYLYKFRAPDERTLAILSQQQLRFSYPREFNDPFDCATRIICQGAKQDWEKFLDEMGLHPDDRSTIENYLASINYDGSTFGKERYQEEINAFIVLSLSEINDHILLWSHYAQNHEGVCFGFGTRIEGNSMGILFTEPTLTFSLPDVSKGFLPVQKVRYSKVMPDTYNRLKDDDKKLVEFTITKHSDWCYEAERRIVLPISYVGGQFLKYDKMSLKQVIFGYRLKDTYRQQVYDTVNDHFKGIPIEFYQAKPKEGEYSLVIERVN